MGKLVTTQRPYFFVRLVVFCSYFVSKFEAVSS